MRGGKSNAADGETDPQIVHVFAGQDTKVRYPPAAGLPMVLGGVVNETELVISRP